jgi:hypothetical protein
MDDGYGGPFSVIYNGTDNTQQLSYQIAGLMPSFTYRFRGYALDVNGPGKYNSIVSI